jgi:hypothetical protein
MVGFLWVTGFSSGVIIALMFTFIPILPGIRVLQVTVQHLCDPTRIIFHPA